MTKTKAENDIEDFLDQIEPDPADARDASHIRRIIAAAEELEQAEDELRAAVAQARAAGDTWDAIGVALGVSRQAAYQRFGKAAQGLPNVLISGRQMSSDSYDEPSRPNVGASKIGDPNSRHVVPNPEGGWDVCKPGVSGASAHYDTQADAIDRARQILRNDGGGELRTHGRDGKIRDSNTIQPGNDPFPPLS